MSHISNTVKTNTFSTPMYGGGQKFTSSVKPKPTAKKEPVVWGMPSGVRNPSLQQPGMNTSATTPSSLIAPNSFSKKEESNVGQVASTNTAPTNTGGGLVNTPNQTSPESQLATAKTELNRLLDIQKQRYGTSTNQSSNIGQSTPVKGVLETPNKFSQFTEGLLENQGPTKEQRAYLRKLEAQSLKGEEIGRKASAISEKYGSEIARVGQLGAGAVAGARSTGTDVVGRGNANLAAESASNRINSLSAAQAAELQGTQQQLTGSQQGITGLTSALQGANTQQQLGISALGTGGQLALPSPAQYGQTVFDPTTGGFNGDGGNMDPQIQAQTLSQQVLNGTMTYDQAVASLGYAGNAGTNFLNSAITQAGGNPLQLQAQNAGQQANIATQTTAGTDIARVGLQQETQAYVQMTNFAEVANQQAGAVSNILAQTGLNEVSSTDYNRGLNELKARFSDTDFASLNTALQEAQIAYSNLLSTGGGTPSGRESAALNTLNINQSSAAINASIQELENAVSRKLQAQYGALQQYEQNLGSGQTAGGGIAGGFAEAW